MGLIWMDGFDAYGNGSTSDVDSILQSAGYTSANALVLDTNTRNGIGAAVKFPDTSLHELALRKSFETKSEIVYGFAVKTSPSTFNKLTSMLYDNLFGTITSQMGVWANGVGGLSISIDGTNMLAASAPNIFFPSVWHYLEIRYKPGHDDGSITVRLDGVDVINYTGKTCPDNTPALVNNVKWMNASWTSGGMKWIDDVYICDTNGSSLNDFLGDVQVIALMPDSDSGTNQMTMYGGSVTHASAVNEVPGNADASYLYSNVAGDAEMFGVPALPATILDVLAVSVHCRARKDAPGASGVKLRATLGSDVLASGTLPLTTVYTTKSMVLPVAPDSGIWTKEKVAAMSIGLELV